MSTPLRILLVGPRMQRAMALRAAGARVQHVDSVPEAPIGPLDGAVIDLEDGAAAAQAVAVVRREQPELPVVLLARHEALADLAGVSVMLPPLSGDGILAALTPPRDDVEVRSEQLPVATVPVPAPLALSLVGGAAPVTAGVARPASVPTERTEPTEPTEPMTPTASVEHAAWLPDDDLEPSTPDRLPVPRGLVSRMEQVAAFARASRSVTEVAEDLAGALSARLSSDVAVLVRHGGSWRVVAGVGLRPLEWRDLDELPGAMSVLSADRPTLTIGDSDDMRGQLAGVPLARHLSLVMSLQEDVLVLLGRELPFRKPDVRTMLKLVAGERRDMETARELLRLAASLQRHQLG